MAANSGRLAGKVLFITGASRGIGRAIALKAARDGAKIVVAAKTTEPHPKLAGTIYTVAEEIEKAGGKCLPCVVDIRFEDQVRAAVDKTVSAFGGIDILVNNASAISLTGTRATPMKTYDLMNGINARGTYMCSKLCLPHLMKASNPHILNISPPLNMSPHWFKNHVAYTMAKYGMSMCVLGMAEELRDEGIAVNALWPRTAIYTAAMEMLAGKSVSSQCRKPEIMADAAYVILSGASKSVTGNFFIDDEVIQKAGVTDLEQYSCVPGSALTPDFFLDVAPEVVEASLKGEAGITVESTIASIENLLSEDAVKTVGASFAFLLDGDQPGQWFLALKEGKGSVGKLEGDPKSFDAQMKLSSANFVKMFAGKLNPTMAFMDGSLKITGNVMAAMKLERLMKQMQAKM